MNCSSINHGLVNSFSRFLDEREEVNMQWLQDPKQNNVDNLNNVRREDNRRFRDGGEKVKFMKLKLKVRSKILELYKGASVTLRKVTSPAASVV
jgi:hypothetical protein